MPPQRGSRGGGPAKAAVAAVAAAVLAPVALGLALFNRLNDAADEVRRAPSALASAIGGVVIPRSARAEAQAYINGVHFPHTTTAEEVDAQLVASYEQSKQLPIIGWNLPMTSSRLQIAEQAKRSFVADLSQAAFDVSQNKDGELTLGVSLPKSALAASNTFTDIQTTVDGQPLADMPTAIDSAKLSGSMSQLLDSCTAPYAAQLPSGIERAIASTISTAEQISEAAGQPQTAPRFSTITVQVIDGDKPMGSAQLEAAFTSTSTDTNPFGAGTPFSLSCSNLTRIIK